MKVRSFAFVTLASLVFLPCAQGSEGTLGSRNNPIKVAIVPSGHAAKALQSAAPVAQCIEQKAHVTVDVQVPNSYVAAVEAMGSQKVDLVFGDISSFLMAKKKYNAEALLQIRRYGVSSYQSAIFVKADSPIKDVKDLEGKKFAYSDASSASSYLFPSILMKKNNKKFAQEVATGSMDAALMALMQGQVDATAAYYNLPSKSGKLLDARAKIINIYPDIETKTRILWLSNPIPNEPVFVRHGLPTELKNNLASAISACVKQYPLYINNIEELTPVTGDNTAYDEFIREIENSGLEITNIFAPRKE